MNSSNPLQTEESGIGNDIYYGASAVSPNSNHQVQRVPFVTVDSTAEPVPNLTTTNNFTLTINSNYYTVVLLYSSNKFLL